MVSPGPPQLAKNAAHQEQAGNQQQAQNGGHFGQRQPQLLMNAAWTSSR
jgi:hypothetical protein